MPTPLAPFWSALWIVFVLLGSTDLAFGQSPTSDGGDKVRIYIGTYTGTSPGGSQGIYRLELDRAAGKLSEPVLAGSATSPTFLALHPSQRFLYAVDVTTDEQGRMTGAVGAFAVDSSSGDLQQLNLQPCGGLGASHLVVDRAGEHVLVACYNGGCVAVLPIDADGRVREMSSFVQHHGSGPNRSRQEGPHPHSINLDPANRFAFVPDLGIDQVVVYRFDALVGKLTPNDPPAARVPPGSGPRHFAFHPDGRHAYVINELASTITAFDYDPQAGVLKSSQTISTLPADYQGTNTAAEVQVHPSGKFLYGSNRGHNSIAVFAIDPTTGRLVAVGHQADGIKTPRNFCVDPTGAYVVVANQDGNNLILFRVEPQSGLLRSTGSTVDVPAPVCVKFVELTTGS